ncbi:MULTISPECIES: chemotaxis protein CheW [unclassified Coleofasciculus]|uniref:chemotaxis protein CheW n=1 Tax=unclassified Coleofasciculus TaxID=2692782 RepID=UPI00187EBF87|nr:MULTISPECIES: chemotaxis protein CheW [unclassified Coleofasciculus]MBE9126720.1 chemotaxis protein CheW [Coleofasciculus sp. LEGE 07081]MBE9150080.1 chemotaxis protein CheW [Coleofasciculus sp. LEGE 07092]
MLESSLKLIVFRIGSLNLALPIESVHKIFNQTPIYGSRVNYVGITHVGDQEVTVVDLYRRFFKSDSTRESDSIGYLVIVQNTTGELYGIPVTDTPVLMDVPLSTIRILPESYRRADTLDIASHVAVIPQDGTQLTIFVLDVELLMPIFREIGVFEK